MAGSGEGAALPNIADILKKLDERLKAVEAAGAADAKKADLDNLTARVAAIEKSLGGEA